MAAPSSECDDKLSPGGIVGIVFASLAALMFLVVILGEARQRLLK